MNVMSASWIDYQWIIDRAGVSPSNMFRAIKAVDDNGRIHGMMGYDAWTEGSVVMSIALDNPACFRHLVHPAFHYPFVQENRLVALCTVRGTNDRSLALTKRVGFKEAYRVKDGIKLGEDLVVFEMRREDCRWIAPEFRKAA